MVTQVVVGGLEDRIELFESFIDGCLESSKLRQGDCNRRGLLPLLLLSSGGGGVSSERRKKASLRGIRLRLKVEPGGLALAMRGALVLGACFGWAGGLFLREAMAIVRLSESEVWSCTD